MIKFTKRRLIIAICAVLALALLSFGATSMFATADPTNGGFEGVADGLPMGWVNVSGNASMDYNESMSGTASLKLAGASSAVRQRYIPAVGGETYTIKAQVKVSNAGARPYIEATSYNGANCLGATANTGAYQSFVAGTWNELTLVYTAAPTATYIEVLLSSGNNDATVWIDSVSISGAVSVSDSTGNRIRNGEFDTDTSLWAINGAVSHDFSVGRHGNGSIKITAASANPVDNGTNFSQDGIFVTPGNTYEIKFYYVSDSSGVIPVVQGLAYLGGGEVGTPIENLPAATAGVANQWNEYAVEYTVPANVPAMKLTFTAIAPKDANIWFDAISVRDINEVDSFLSSDNLLLNSGFEEKDLANWGRSSSGTITCDTTKSHTGKTSVKLTNDAQVMKTYIDQTFPAKEGQLYEVGGYFCTDNSSARPFINVSFLDANKKFISSKMIQAISASADWTGLAGVVIAPEGTEYIIVSPNIRNVANATVWFDNVYAAETYSLIANPGFEKPSFLGWDLYSAGTVSYDSEKVYEGSHSLKLTTDSALVAYAMAYVPVEAGESYDIGAYFCTDDSSARPFIAVAYYNASNKAISGTNFNISASSGPSEWTRLSGLAVVPEGAVKMSVAVNIRKLDGVTAWFDSVKVTECLPDGTVARKDNLLLNPSFERDDETWKTSVYVPGAATAIRDTTVSHTGSSSFKFTWNANTRANTQQTVYINGGVYRFVAWYRTEDMITEPKISCVWKNTDGTNGQSPMAGDVVGTNGWKRMIQEIIIPDGVRYINIYPDLTTTSGSVWYDDLALYKISVDPMPGTAHTIQDTDFEATGSESPWAFKTRAEGTAQFDTSVKKSGKQSVRLSATSIEDEAEVTQLNLRREDGLSVCVKVDYKTEDVTGVPYVKLMWYDADGNFISSSYTDLAPADIWTTASVRGDPVAGASKYAVVLGISEGKGTVWFDNIDAFSCLFNVYGDPVIVSNVVNINESFYDPSDNNPNNDDPSKFWNLLPKASISEPKSTLWAESFFRTSFFGITDYGEVSGYVFNLPEKIKTRDDTLPQMEGLLGASAQNGPELAIATDIEFNPFMRAHGNYAKTYYPRREADYLKTDYVPSYVLTGDEYFKTRGTELVNFMKFSQWQPDGSNAFTKKYYTNHSNPDEAYAPHPEWRGGFDYLFDWQWHDGSGNTRYMWDYHETDHHVCSLLVSNILNAYEVFDLDDSVLDMAREFVYYQVPRYGFHSGEWDGHTYYWTEYNPSGEGNPVIDAVDNIQALVASVVATVAYYEENPVLKAQYLEYVRGLLWYMVREFESEDRWFYIGAEYIGANDGPNVSHDAVCYSASWRALAYLYRAGGDVSDLLPRFEEINRISNLTLGSLQRKRYVQVAKVYDGEPKYGNSIKFTSFINVTTNDLENARFSDTIPEYGFVTPVTMEVRISHLLPPTATCDDWTIDPNEDVVYIVTPTQLKDGINIPFTLKYGEQYKVSYSLRIINSTSFDRTKVADTASAISAWVVDENNDATFVKNTAITSAGSRSKVGADGFVEPIGKDFNIGSDNFMSYGAKLHFNFDREVNSQLRESTAARGQRYVDDDTKWANLGADTYIYPTASLLPDLVRTDGSPGGIIYLPWGSSFSLNKVSAATIYNINVPATNNYQVNAAYLKMETRGIIQMYIDNVKQGSAYDLYAPYPNEMAYVEEVSLGTKNLKKGQHELKYMSVGKNESSSSYTVGLYHALILKPVG